MSSLEAFMADLIGPDTKIILGDSGAEVDIATFLALAAQELDDEEVTPPKRDTPEYREAITLVSEMDDVERVVTALRLLHGDYGWRGPVDVMTWWVLQIERSPLFNDGHMRDFTGAVDLRQVIVIDADEEQRLRIAAEKKDQYEAQGLAPHLAFQKGLAETESGIALCERWFPYFRAALIAAHAAPTDTRRAVLAELYKAPGRKDPDELVTGAMILGTAAYGVRHHYSMAARYQSVSGDRPVSTDEAIAPGWTTGGAYMTRSALRRRR